MELNYITLKPVHCGQGQIYLYLLWYY